MTSDDSNQINDLTRDVYAHFGLAYYETECLHRALVQVYAMLQPVREATTRPMVLEREAVAAKMTLGDLVSLTNGLLPADLHKSIDWALAQRNFLAHGFWYERIHWMSDIDGMNQMIEFLTDISNGISSLSAHIQEMISEELRVRGVSDEALSAAMEECKSSPAEPPPNRRILKTDERLDVVEAWIAEKSMLVLRDCDGELWQLCDVGLGWSFLKPSTTWKKCKTLAGFLPARIVARPKGASQWNYSLHVSTGALIRIRRNLKAKTIIWEVERIEKKSSGR